MNESKFLMNKQIYLGFTILDFSRVARYKFWYDKLKTYYSDKGQLSYIDTGTFIIDIKSK